MAVRLRATASESLGAGATVPSGLATTFPWSAAVRFYSTSTAAVQSLLEFQGTSSNYQLLGLTATGGVGISSKSATTGIVSAFTTSPFVNGQWHWAIGVWGASASRQVFLDGGASGTNTSASLVPTSATIFRSGCFLSAGAALATNFLNGAIAEIAIWDVGLTTAEIAQFANPIGAEFVRGGDLTYHWRLDEGNHATVHGRRATFSFNATGTTGGGVATDNPHTLRWKPVQMPVMSGANIFTKTLNAVAVGVVKLQRRISTTKRVSAAVVIELTLLVLKTLRATAVGVATVDTARVLLRSFAAVAIGVAKLTKQVNTTKAAQAVGLPKLQRLVFKYLKAVAVGVAAVSTTTIGGVIRLSFAAVAVGVSKLQLTVRTTKALTATGAPKMNLLVRKTLKAVAVGVAALSTLYIPAGAVVTAVATHIGKFIGNIGHMMGRR